MNPQTIQIKTDRFGRPVLLVINGQSVHAHDIKVVFNRHDLPVVSFTMVADRLEVTQESESPTRAGPMAFKAETTVGTHGELQGWAKDLTKLGSPEAMRQMDVATQAINCLVGRLPKLGDPHPEPAIPAAAPAAKPTKGWEFLGSP